ncbi:class II aldolase/adducin family protein [Amycolatopsis sp. NPDC089917]|uniref:class II aldolase/adducin family protein n=1 Tax=Amycolatopsis sp. NPDC089917 TaxID=3155187 RepID=UPI00342110BF
MLYEAERQLLVESINDMARWGLIETTGGGLSVRADNGDIIVTATGSAFARWKVTPRDMTVISATGELRERTGGVAPVGALIHMAAYEMFPDCRAIVHAHSAYVLAFASLGMGIPSCVNQLDTLGEVPCLIADDTAVKGGVLSGESERPEVELPDGIAQRPEIAAVDTYQLIPQLKEKLGPRADELKRHGLACVLYRHGAFTFARGLTEAVENLARVEMSARTAVFQAILRGGLAGIEPNLLFPKPGLSVEQQLADV